MSETSEKTDDVPKFWTDYRATHDVSFKPLPLPGSPGKSLLKRKGNSFFTKGLNELYTAIEGENAPKVKELLKSGVPLPRTVLGTHRNTTPLRLAIEMGNEEISNLIKNEYHNRDKEKFKEYINSITEKNININKNDDKLGMPPLHIAVQRGYKDVVTSLLEKGADINAKDEREYTPLHIAAENGRENIVKLLINNGANKNVQTKYGQTALDLAKEQEIKKLLNPMETQEDNNNNGGKRKSRKRKTTTRRKRKTTTRRKRKTTTTRRKRNNRKKRTTRRKRNNRKKRTTKKH